MHYEYYGNIKINDSDYKENIIKTVVDGLLKEDDDLFDYYKEQGYFDQLDIHSDYMVSEGSCGYDDMDSMKTLFYIISGKVIELYPGCNMDVHFVGSNMSSGSEWVLLMDLKDHHVRKIDVEGDDDGIYCPNCDEFLMSISEVEFDTKYECPECDETITSEEILEELSDFYEEYDIEAPESKAFVKEKEGLEKIIKGKIFISTGLTEKQEESIRSVVEKNGGIYKDNFVVSLNYLVYNPDYDHETVKLKKAREQVEKGKEVKIITWDEFKEMVW